RAMAIRGLSAACAVRGARASQGAGRRRPRSQAWCWRTRAESVMPGTLHLELYDMDVISALAIMLTKFPPSFAGADEHELEEIRRAARNVVETHAWEVAQKYIAPPLPATILKLVKSPNSKD